MTITRWYAERRGLNASTDEDRAMASQRLGPFASQEAARLGLIDHFRAGAEAALEGTSHGSVAHLFGRQYVGLLAMIAEQPDLKAWTHEGIQWSLRGVEVPEDLGGLLQLGASKRTEHESVPVDPAGPTKVTVALNVANLTPAMRKALLDEHATLNTARAMKSRGFVSSWDLARGGRYPLNLTEAGKRAAAKIAELDAEGIIPTERAPERRNHSWGLGRLESAVENYLRALDGGFPANSPDDEIRLLRSALADVRAHCPIREG